MLHRKLIVCAAALALGCVPLATTASAAARAGAHAGVKGGHAVAGHARGGHFAGRHVGGRRVVRGYRGNGGYAGYGGGYAGYMTSAGVTMIADGTDAADERLQHALTNDTALGVMRYADAGYDEAIDEADLKQVPWLGL